MPQILKAGETLLVNCVLDVSGRADEAKSEPSFTSLFAASETGPGMGLLPSSLTQIQLVLQA
jgi:hypothetical protein